ncbi:MAG TPA: hypothetical protein VEB21_19870 [Terriglobales bacterium]|nr:hypothetical protein [Terriglobales bacterium]
MWLRSAERGEIEAAPNGEDRRGCPLANDWRRAGDDGAIASVRRSRAGRALLISAAVYENDRSATFQWVSSIARGRSIIRPIE